MTIFIAKKNPDPLLGDEEADVALALLGSPNKIRIPAEDMRLIASWCIENGYAPKAKSGYRVEFYTGKPDDKDGRFRWRAVARNGKTVAQGEGYKSKAARLKTVRNLFPDLPIVEVSWRT